MELMAAVGRRKIPHMNNVEIPRRFRYGGVSDPGTIVAGVRVSCQQCLGGSGPWSELESTNKDTNETGGAV